MKKFLGVICCILIGILAVSVIAYGQNESAPKPTEMATPSTISGATITPLSISALENILSAVVILVIIPIVVFALYNYFSLKRVLDANEKMVVQKDEKGEQVTKLLKALVPPEPLGMPNGSVRAIIAIVGISIFAYAIFAFADYRKELLSALVSLLSAVIGFYFGARATEEVRGEKKKPTE